MKNSLRYIACIIGVVGSWCYSAQETETILQKIVNQATHQPMPIELAHLVARYLTKEVFACGFICNDKSGNAIVVFDDFDLGKALQRINKSMNDLDCVFGLDHDKQLHYLIKKTKGPLVANNRNGIEQAFNPSNRGIWFHSDEEDLLLKRLPEGIGFEGAVTHYIQQLNEKKEPYTMKECASLPKKRHSYRSNGKRRLITRFDALLDNTKAEIMPLEVQNIIHQYLQQDTIDKSSILHLSTPSTLPLWAYRVGSERALLMSGVEACQQRGDVVARARQLASEKLPVEDILGPVKNHYRQDLVGIAHVFGKTKLIQSIQSCYLQDASENPASCTVS